MDEFISLKIPLEKDLWFALRSRAMQEYREPAAQIRYLLRNALLSGQQTNTHCDAKTLAERNVTAGVGVNP